MRISVTIYYVDTDNPPTKVAEVFYSFCHFVANFRAFYGFDTLLFPKTVRE